MATAKKSSAYLSKRPIRGLSVPSFQLIPLTSDCPFEAAMFDPQLKLFLIIGKSSFESVKTIGKINSNGTPVITKSKGETFQVQERIKVNNLYETAILEKEEIIEYVSIMSGTTKFKDGDELSELIEQLFALEVGANV
jgi:hypothetical protein